MDAILLVDHGSRRSEANALLERVAERARTALPGWLVWTAHLEIAQPDIPTAIDGCVASGATRLVIAPYFLAPGRHSRKDLPAILERARARHPGVQLELADPLGFDERIADVAIERAVAALAAAREPGGSEG